MSRVALVLGGARSVYADVQAALDLGEFQGAVACNDIGIVWPGALDAWVSLHVDNFRGWNNRRLSAGRPPHKALYGHAFAPGPDIIITPYKFQGQDNSGSSGLFALKVALVDLGFDKAVLCGIPMSADGNHFFDPRPWDAAQHHQKAWREALPQIENRARSMSGWTSTLLGKPDENWLAQ